VNTYGKYSPPQWYRFTFAWLRLAWFNTYPEVCVAQWKRHPRLYTALAYVVVNSWWLVSWARGVGRRAWWVVTGKEAK